MIQMWQSISRYNILRNEFHLTDKDAKEKKSTSKIEIVSNFFKAQLAFKNKHSISSVTFGTILNSNSII